MRDPDPYAVFDFVVEITGLQVAGFSEVAGLQAETETEDYREGGTNHYVHKLAKLTKFSNVTLKRGIIDHDLWDWYQDVINGTVKRRTVSLVLRDQTRRDKWRWDFEEAYPVKWSSTDLNASGNTIAVESVEFAHHGMKASPAGG